MATRRRLPPSPWARARAPPPVERAAGVCLRAHQRDGVHAALKLLVDHGRHRVHSEFLGCDLTVETLRSGVPTPVAELIARCLEKEAGRRFQSAGEILETVLDLRGDITPG